MADPSNFSTGTTAGSDVDDALIAQKLSVIDQLTSIFGFDVAVAEQVVEKLTLFDGTKTTVPDATTAYNYILDNQLAQDRGGPVIPIMDCPHVKDHVQLSADDPDSLPTPDAMTVCQHHEPSSRSSGGTGREKAETDDRGSCPGMENWLCLQCGTVRCSRYVNGHAREHFEAEKQHPLAVSLSDLSIWCYDCNSYVHHPSMKDLLKVLEERKNAVIISQSAE